MINSLIVALAPGTNYLLVSHQHSGVTGFYLNMASMENISRGRVGNKVAGGGNSGGTGEVQG